MERINHIIYVYDNPQMKNQNMAFLIFIKNNRESIKNMGVYLIIKLINAIDAQLLVNITNYPTLVTPNKVYTGYKEIVNIYQTNIKAYNSYNKKSTPVATREIETDDDIHDYFKSQIRGVEKEVETDSFGDSGNMMDSYRMMVDKRNKGIKKSTLRTIETPIEEKQDNIKQNTESDEKIKIPERDIDDDPQDEIIEKAYWSRISESK